MVCLFIDNNVLCFTKQFSSGVISYLFHLLPQKIMFALLFVCG